MIKVVWLDKKHARMGWQSMFDLWPLDPPELSNQAWSLTLRRSIESDPVSLTAVQPSTVNPDELEGALFCPLPRSFRLRGVKQDAVATLHYLSEDVGKDLQTYTEWYSLYKMKQEPMTRLMLFVFTKAHCCTDPLPDPFFCVW